MARRTGYRTRVLIDGHDISNHVMAVDFKVRPSSLTTVIELGDAAVETDPETGAMTFRIGTPNTPDQTSTTTP